MKHIANDIKQGTFKQIYLLYGEESYLKRQYTGRLKEALCGNDEMNTHFYEGKDVPVGEIIDLAETLPFLAERRVIFISGSGLFKSGGEKMAEYLASPNETTFFVFTEDKVDKRSKLFNTVQKNGYAAEFAVQDEATLKRWILGILKREGKNISENTFQLFLSKTGTDMENIYMELEKLICYTLGQDVITSEDVETICTTRVSDRIFDMINAIADKQTEKALSLYYDLLALDVEPMPILSLITRHFNILWQAKAMRAKGFDNKAIGDVFSFKPYIAGKYVAQASKFKTSELKKAVEQCVEAEAAIKSGKMDKVLSVELLMMSLLPAAH